MLLPDSLQSQTVLKLLPSLNIDKNVLCVGETATITITRCATESGSAWSYITTENTKINYKNCQYTGCSLVGNVEPNVTGDGVVSKEVTIRRGCATDPLVQSRIEIKVKPSVTTTYKVSWTINLYESADPECGKSSEYIYQTQIYESSIEVPVVQRNPPTLTPSDTVVVQSPYYSGAIIATAETFVTNSRGMRFYSSESGSLQQLPDHFFYDGKSSGIGINATKLGSYEVYAKKIDNGCVSDMSSPSRITIVSFLPDTSKPKPKPPAKPLKVYMIDPQKADMVKDDGSINTDISSLKLENNVEGAVTDSISKILLVAESDEAVTFSLSESKSGTLSSLDDQSLPGNQSLTATPDGSGKVAIIYTAPDGYGADNPKGGRKISVTATSQSDPNNTTSKDIKLVTPPVILVHGMWSSPDVWLSGNFVKMLKANGYTKKDYFLANYESHNAETFNPNSGLSIYGRNAIQSQIDAAIKNYRERQLAISQVDIVGHSLGGLMARSLSQQKGFKNTRNYFKGYFNKLITIGTPHRGSPLGPELWNNRNNYVTLYSNKTITIEEFLKSRGMPIGSCHPDFGVQSPGIQALTPTLPYKTHSIVGIYQQPNLPEIETAKYIMEFLCWMCFDKSFDKIFASRCNSDIPLLNDLIVPIASQSGYIANNTPFNGPGHSDPAMNTETNNIDIQEKVCQLLLSDDKNEFAKGFPAPSEQPLDCFTPSMRISQSNSAHTKTGDANRFVEIISPQRGAIYAQKSGSQIKLSFHLQGISSPARGLFFINDLDQILPIRNVADTISFTLPANARLGRINVGLLIQDTAGTLFADTSHIIIRTENAWDSIVANQTPVLLDSAIRDTELFVLGYTKSGDSIISEDITRGSAGTTYQTLKGPSVINVSSDGIVTAVSGGADTLIINNNGITTVVPVHVDDNFKHVTRFPNAIDFLPISNRSINDEPFVLSATSSSGEKVAFSVISGPATIDNGIITLTGAGMVTVQATCPGNVYFETPIPVKRTFEVTTPSLFSFLSFTASLNNYNAQLYWSTMQEQNVRYFSIQRSSDGINFDSIATKSATGNVENNYKCDDNIANLNYKSLYYRIKGVLKNGNSLYSKNVLIELPYNKDSIFVYPNPSKGIINIHLRSIAGEEFQFKLYDINGRLLMTQKLKNLFNQQIKLNTRIPGAYRLVIFGNNKKILEHTIIVAD